MHLNQVYETSGGVKQEEVKKASAGSAVSVTGDTKHKRRLITPQLGKCLVQKLKWRWNNNNNSIIIMSINTDKLITRWFKTIKCFFQQAN